MDITKWEEMPIVAGREVVAFKPQPEPDGSLKHWQIYVQDMMACRHISDAAIYQLQDGSLLASSRPEFSLSPEEYQNLTEGILLPNMLRENGIQVNGVTYQHHVSDGKYGIMGRRGMPVCGVSACRTGSLLLVAVHGPKMKPVVCNETVMTLGDFFLAKGL